MENVRAMLAALKWERRGLSVVKKRGSLDHHLSHRADRADR
jgi:hypothetical protein